MMCTLMPSSSLTRRIIFTHISVILLNVGCSRQMSRKILITRFLTLMPVSCEDEPTHEQSNMLHFLPPVGGNRASKEEFTQVELSYSEWTLIWWKKNMLSAQLSYCSDDCRSYLTKVSMLWYKLHLVLLQSKSTWKFCVCIGWISVWCGIVQKLLRGSYHHSAN